MDFAADYLVEIEEPVIEVPLPAIGPVEEAIGRHVASIAHPDFRRELSEGVKAKRSIVLPAMAAGEAAAARQCEAAPGSGRPGSGAARTLPPL